MTFSELDDFRSLRRGKRNGAFRQAVRLPDLPPAPDSVVHQYRGENFQTDTWEDTAPSGPQADMSITGVSASTLNGARAASSDGVDDFGLANGPQDLPEKESFGIAFVVNSTDKNDVTFWMGARDTNKNAQFGLIDFNISDNTNGEITFNLRDTNRNTIRIEGTTDVQDGDTHLICINKNSDDAGDVSFYIDNMDAETTVNVRRNQSFDNTDYLSDVDMGFFGGNTNSGFDFHKTLDLPFIEFKQSPYSPLERQALKRRAPGL
jgi:hypothetical protein